MSGANYARCAVCGGKAFYDADTDYGGAEHAALCGECSKGHLLAVLPKGPPMTDFEVEAVRFRLEQRKAHEAILDRLKKEADEHRSPEFKAWLAGDRSVWGDTEGVD
ncbi:hypothetical protein AB0X98_01030 [Rothia koreensis]|uniref:hypothetical protein n=1 Tax=Rothia koreensis TaxID=592378 RepID=UPI003F1F75C9